MGRWTVANGPGLELVEIIHDGQLLVGVWINQTFYRLSDKSAEKLVTRKIALVKSKLAAVVAEVLGV